jgi:hypothetical protein
MLVLWETAVVGERLELEEAVADTLVLWDISVVGERLGLEEVVADTVLLWDTTMIGEGLELEVQDIDTDGELEITGPAPTATNAIFDDCIQFVTVAGSVSPTV